MINFIILHYKNMHDTLECIASIRKLETDKQVKIVVVDNASTNQTEQAQLKKEADDVLFLEKNIGFAKGNNAGAIFAVEKYHPDFLVVINSDVVIEQKNFLKTIYSLHDKYQFDILGPKILPEESDSVNPFPAYKTLDEVQQRIKYVRKLIKIYNNVIFRNLLSFYLKLKKNFKKEEKLANGKNDILGEPLHGCALIFSRQYYQKYKDIFYNETFLFHEEEFLYYRCKQDNLVFVYSPEIELIHKEGQSLDKEFNTNYQKLIFKNQEILKSLILLEDIMINKKRI